jgi:hypothetical protein
MARKQRYGREGMGEGRGERGERGQSGECGEGENFGEGGMEPRTISEVLEVDLTSALEL